MAKHTTFAALDKLEATPFVAKHRPHWSDNLPAGQRQELEEFRQRYQAGKYRGRTDVSLWEYWRDEYKLEFEATAFFRWLKRKP